ncbi:mitochondrial fission 1 protein isoform X1 [Vicugna pacos]|uniref:Mitochondrial fission 1 protein isoform X1 n=1 Tax=Vicugna pacos TaxID=30538 RepID=A0ABM5BS80_VICPA
MLYLLGAGGAGAGLMKAVPEANGPETGSCLPCRHSDVWWKEISSWRTFRWKKGGYYENVSMSKARGCLEMKRERSWRYTDEQDTASALTELTFTCVLEHCGSSSPPSLSAVFIPGANHEDTVSEFLEVASIRRGTQGTRDDKHEDRGDAVCSLRAAVRVRRGLVGACAPVTPPSRWRRGGLGVRCVKRLALLKGGGPRFRRTPEVAPCPVSGPWRPGDSSVLSCEAFGDGGHGGCAERIGVCGGPAELLPKGSKEEQRDYVFYLAVGNYRLKEYEKALKYVRGLLQTEPQNNQAKELERLIDKAMKKDGLVGMAIVGGMALGVAGLAGLIGLAVSKSKS